MQPCCPQVQWRAVVAARISGPGWQRFVPPGSIARSDVDAFNAAWALKHGIVSDGPDEALLAAGDGDWTFPSPIVKSAAIVRFDPGEGWQKVAVPGT
ncbi:DUF2950 family protein [Variovorax sp. J22P168]|uniref:DUF2950 family protein n=1 Tax=Variovorax jilinensis TaxID=3053513 RepID=UPI00257859DA|nr:DUF2950 family protein [Variovorax sp. J22P168]MDM0011953.1 DUF2950 family protein [Variovorax sp. J22P168]